MFKKIILSPYALRAFISFNFCLAVSLATAEDTAVDSIRHRDLHEVKVNANHLKTTRAALPVQIITEKELGRFNASNISDIAKHFAGVTVKDYGGIGGLKTVSIRGLGAQYTGVSFDGVLMSDIQSGQIDLGRISIENLSEISLSNGQPNNFFQSARMFSFAGVLNLTTKYLEYNPNKSFSGKLSLKTGSFGLWNPVMFLSNNIGKKWSLNISTNAQIANGKYPFLQYYGSKQNISEELIRQNSDIKSISSELNSLYRIKPKESISLKVNYFGSERGLPGNVTFYNTVSSLQRLTDKTLFAQLHYLNQNSKKIQHQYTARFNRAKNTFTDFDPKYSASNGLLNDNYLQKEYYLSSAFQYHLLNSLTITSAIDWWYNNLDIKSNVSFKNFQYPTRNTGLANLAAKYVSESLTLGANILYTLSNEKVKIGVAAPQKNKLSPTVSFSYRILENKELRIRAFYKNIYRLPTFNDLYYQNIGNHNLRPENANQYNIGFTYLEKNIPFISEFSFIIDGYHNEVTDKIIAIPQDMFHWSMINKNKVKINGIDLNMKINLDLGKANLFKINGNYSFQSAKDATKDSENFGEQIPYTPLHSGTSSISYQHNNWETGYNLTFSGTRWIGQTTNIYNKMDSYLTHSIFINSTYKRLSFSAEIINLFNTQYEVVMFYPMPRRNCRVTVGITL